MKRAIRIAGVLALGWIAGCGGQAMKEEPSVTSVEIAAIQRAEDLGRQIYTHDVYAAQATDLLLAHGVDLAEMDARGWITESLSDGCVVTYVTGDAEQWRSVCVVTFASDREPNVVLVDKDLTEAQAAMFDARQHAVASIAHPCSDAYNTVVLPRQDGPGWLAYALAATSDPNLILVGGHYRVTVSADGRTVLDRRGFAKTCLVLEKKPQDLPPGAELAAYTVSHLLDNVPTEIHAFLSLHCGKPLYVATPDARVWYVEYGKVRLLGRR